MITHGQYTKSANISTALPWRLTFGLSLVVLCIIGETYNQNDQNIPDAYKASTAVKAYTMLRIDLIERLQTWFTKSFLPSIENLYNEFEEYKLQIYDNFDGLNSFLTFSPQ